ncbi:hypothetical protein ABID65_008701 [Bradyrhizobium sp. S3.9.2]
MSQRFRLISNLLNIPLSVAMVTHGGALLFPFWHVMSRRIFERPRTPD